MMPLPKAIPQELRASFNASVGRTLAQRYRIEKKLGSGNYGTAYLAQDLTSNKEWVVVKEILTGTLQPDETVDAVMEAKLLAKLNHPGIVRFKDSFVDGEFFCIATEYCEGGDLADKIAMWKKEKRTFSESLVLDWFVQLMLAIQYMHQMRVLHRDLKTRNIFLKKNMIKIGDFGISRIMMGTADMASTFVGTPYYMSPEVIKHEGYNSKSDVWSAGCILHELCTLKHAFDGAGLMGVMYAIVEGATPSLPSPYSKQLADVLNVMLIKDPTKRPSATEVLKIPHIASHMEMLKQKMNVTRGANTTNDAQTTAATAAQLSHMTPMERLNLRKQKKADEAAKKHKQLAAENFEKNLERKQKLRTQTFTEKPPWVAEHPDVFNSTAFQPNLPPRRNDAGNAIGGKKPDNVEEDDYEEDFEEEDDEIPADPKLADTYYSQYDDFESSGDEEAEEAEESGRQGKRNRDDFGQLIHHMQNALKLDASAGTFGDVIQISTSARIKNLRRQCESVLGSDFIKVYSYLNKVRFQSKKPVKEEEVMKNLRRLTKQPGDCFLVDQLLFLEEQAKIEK